MYLPHLSHFFFLCVLCVSQLLFFCYCTSGIDMSNFHSTTLLKKCWCHGPRTYWCEGPGLISFHHIWYMQMTAPNKHITTQEKNTSYYNSNISLCNCEIYLGSFSMQYCSDKPAHHNALLLLQPTP